MQSEKMFATINNMNFTSVDCITSLSPFSFLKTENQLLTIFKHEYTAQTLNVDYFRYEDSLIIRKCHKLQYKKSWQVDYYPLLYIIVLMAICNSKIFEIWYLYGDDILLSADTSDVIPVSGRKYIDCKN